ncbi:MULTISPECIES: isopentenyl transferase family protein [unclassified Mesorhizobium]|uniref:isopentenyl transferase family protein n=1 Tax=unclassified Mesorhizobium TaxID=325217 RepID=UPI0009FDCAA8
MARETGRPVIALDRVQCCPQIATGSERASDSELQSTQRVYLDTPPNRGHIHAVTTRRKLIMHVDELRSQPGLTRSRLDLPSQFTWRESASGWRFQWHVRRWRLGNSDAFVERAKRVVCVKFCKMGRP